MMMPSISTKSALSQSIGRPIRAINLQNASKNEFTDKSGVNSK